MRGISKDTPASGNGTILRDAMLRIAPQDEEWFVVTNQPGCRGPSPTAHRLRWLPSHIGAFLLCLQPQNQAVASFSAL
jgi:hypothetical protein